MGGQFLPQQARAEIDREFAVADNVEGRLAQQPAAAVPAQHRPDPQRQLVSRLPEQPSCDAPAAVLPGGVQVADVSPAAVPGHPLVLSGRLHLGAADHVPGQHDRQAGAVHPDGRENDSPRMAGWAGRCRPSTLAR